MVPSSSRSDWVLTLLLLLLVHGGVGCAFAQQAGAPGCIGEDGGQVDFWVILKVPQSGQYTYLDSKAEDLMDAVFKTVPNKSIQTPTGNPLADTLQQVYGHKGSSLSYVMYNDVAPDGSTASTDEGTGKGVWATGPGGGFWLTHSLNNFPASGSYNGIPSSEAAYGHSMFCISMSIEDMDKTAGAFLYNHIHVYDSNVAVELSSLLPNFGQVVAGNKWQAGNYNMIDISTRVSKEGLTLYALTASFAQGRHLYNVIGNSWGSDFLVDAGLTGSQQPEAPYCGEIQGYPHSVNNVIHVAVADDAFGFIDWQYTDDHSKWFVAPANANHPDRPAKWSLVCFGDISRTEKQESRAGGAVCLENDFLWAAFIKAIVQHDKCSSYGISSVS